VKEYRIISKYREEIIINEIGQVLARKPVNRGWITFNKNNYDTWVITGAWYHKGFGWVGFISLEKLLSLDRSELLYKNGKPIYGLTDIDHGTARMQGNKDAHGVWLIKEVA